MVKRMNEPRRDSCVVCGSGDARSLSTTTLADGSEVPVCGSHALSHARSGRLARTLADLRDLTGERRRVPDRRSVAVDELARSLTDAFAPGRPRAQARRRSSS